MANGVKTYQIKIDGIDKSIDAVKSLEKELFNLEQKIAAVSKQAVNVKTSGGGYSGGSTKASNASSLSEEEKLAKQIEAIDAKRIAYSKEIYQNYLAAKDVLSETVKDQKSVAASERLQAKSYSNTIAGMKQEFADIKAVMQTVDLGDSGEFDRLTQRANELNEALKKIEATYVQFGRNVGNYESAFNSLDKLVIKVGDADREFNNAREASRTLKNELINLEAAGKGSTQEADNLRKAIYNLKSIMDDATKSSKAMDTAMDFMQSFTAMASIGNGLKSFFGFDDNEITKSIQKLVALQGVLNGLESIRKQMETQEGIGKLLSKNSEGVDEFVTSLTGAEKVEGKFIGQTKQSTIAINLFAKALKGLTAIGWMAVITVAVDALQKLGTAVSDWVKGDADLISSTDVVNAALDSQNRILEERLKLVQANMNANNITPEQARLETEKSYAKALEETNKRLKDREDILGRNNMRSPRKGTINLDSVMGDKGTTTVGGFDKAIESIDDFIKRWDELEKAVANKRGFSTMLSTASDANDEFEHLAKLVGRDFVNAIHLFSDGTQEGARQLSRYIDKMDELTGGRYSKAIQLVKVDNEALQKELDEAWKLVQNLRDNVFKNPIIVKIELDTKIEQELDRLDPTRPMRRQIDEWKGLLERGVNEAGDKLSVEEVANINKIVKEQEKALKKARRDRAKSERNDAKAIANETENYRKQLRELQIQNMEEGWAKEKAALEEELRQKLFIIKNNGVKVKQLELETRKLYNKKIQDAEREHNAKMAAIYKESWDEIYRKSDETFRMNSDTELTRLDNELDTYKSFITKSKSILSSFSPRYASYGGTKFDNNFKESLKKDLGYIKENKNNGDIGDDGFKTEYKKAKEYLDLLEQIKLYSNKSEKFGDFANKKEIDTKYNEASEALDEWLEKNKETSQHMSGMVETQTLIQNGYTKELKNAYKIRIREASAYFDNVERAEEEHSEKVMKNELALLKNEENAEKRAEQDRFENQMAELNANLRDGLMTRQHYDELVERAYEEHGNALKAIGDRADAEQERLQQEHQDRLKQITSDGLRGMLNEYRDAYDAISKLQSRQPQLMKSQPGEFGIESGLGAFGVVSISATKKNYKEALDAYKELSQNILQEKEALQKKFDRGEITFNDFQQAKRELDGLAQDTADAAQEVTENLKDVGGEFIRSIQQYIQFFGQGLQQIMQAVWSAQDIDMDKEQDALDKENERLEKALEKNEEILEKHSNNVNDIEDELSSARGDRRQHLIDQLNAETEAQREAAQEKKRIEKEQEALQRKQDALDKKRKEAQYKRDLANILVSGAMAAVNAYATKPFVPVGLTMGSLALALTAAQYAIAKSAKPYAHGGQLEGGVADGPRHSQGGIKVLGGRAEIEGGEFITNRTSTAKNIDLLEYVNSQKRKVDINDLIDFYSSGKPKKVVQSIRGRFAEGGNLPTLRTDIEVNDRLVSAFEDYAKTPSVVQVVDIIDRTKKVNNVKVLAGLSE